MPEPDDSAKRETAPGGENEREISVRETSELLQSGEPMKLYDVREEWEREIARIEASELLTERTVAELLERGDRDARLIFICHHGMRSLEAAEFFAERGFARTQSMRGGIDAWSNEIDSGIAKY